MGPGRFCPQAAQTPCRLAKMTYTTSFCQNQGQRATDPPIISPLAGSVPQPKITSQGCKQVFRNWQAGKKEPRDASSCLVLSLCCQKQLPNTHVKGKIPQSQIGDPSSRFPHHPGLGRGKAHAKNTTWQRGALRTGRLVGGPSSGRRPEVGHLEEAAPKRPCRRPWEFGGAIPCWQRAADHRVATPMGF